MHRGRGCRHGGRGRRGRFMDRIFEFLDRPARGNSGPGRGPQRKGFPEARKMEMNPLPYRISNNPDSFGKTAAHNGRTAESLLEHPGGYMKKRPRTIRAYVDKALCTGCGICADRCVRNAITIGGTAIIDTNICTGCGKCVDACPAGALVLR